MKKVVVKKLESTTETSRSPEYSTEDSQEYYTETRPRGFVSITNDTYKKPPGGSAQDHFSVDTIRNQLIGHVAFKSIEDKRIVQQLTPFKTWIRYFNTVTKQYRTGGLLLKSMYPDYIILINTRFNLSWSVQLNDCVLYIHQNALQRLYQTGGGTEYTADTSDQYYSEPKHIKPSKPTKPKFRQQLIIEHLDTTVTQDTFEDTDTTTQGPTTTQDTAKDTDTNTTTQDTVKDTDTTTQGPTTTQDTVKDTDTTTQDTVTTKEQLVKEKLYKLYKSGRLAVK